MKDWITAMSQLPFWQGKSRDRSIVGLNMLLLVLLAYSLATLTWRLLPTPAPEAGVSAPVVTDPVVVNAPNGGAIQTLASLHLFGEVVEEAPVVEVPETAPDTSLNLTLRGVVAADEDTDESARAIIGGPDGSEDSFAIGDTLPGNATLKQIHADRVILQHNGRFETLRLPKDENSGSVPVAVRGGMQPQTADGAAESLRTVRERLISNPAGLLDMVNVAPVPVAGGDGLQGYRLMPGRDRRIFHQLGLRPGDVITSVNGIALSDPAQGNQALQSLTRGESVSLQVRRNGVEQQINLNMDQTLGP